MQLQSHSEQILVVKRATLLPHGSWHGVKKVDTAEYLNIIQQHQEFHPRAAMEVDPSYKQIIPYLVFRYENRYFLMQRAAKASETRLQNKYTLGIGGHMRQEDLAAGSTIFDWARREFDEEITYTGKVTSIEFLGLLNDDTNDVGRVHIGVVLLLNGDSSAIAVKEELQSGHLATLQECQQLASHLESWSQLLLPLLT